MFESVQLKNKTMVNYPRIIQLYFLPYSFFKPSTDCVWSLRRRTAENDPYVQEVVYANILMIK